MKDSDIKTISDCEKVAESMNEEDVRKWVNHLRNNLNNDSHLEVKLELLKHIEKRFLKHTCGVGRKEVNKGLEPSWTDCCEGSCI